VGYKEVDGVMVCQVDCDAFQTMLYDVWRDGEFVTSVYICPSCAENLRNEGYILEVVYDDSNGMDAVGVGCKEKVHRAGGEKSGGNATE
jgi:hypothetical protein